MANPKINTADAIAEIRKLIKSFNDLSKATSTMAINGSKNVKSIETNLASLKDIAQKTSGAFNVLEKKYQTSAAQSQRFAQSTEKLKKSVEGMGSKVLTAERHLAKAQKRKCVRKKWYKTINC